MPELPEVQALVDFLAQRTVGLAVVGVELGSISVLKTYDPPPSALAGGPIDGVHRHGKFLDVDVDGIHLVFHLARAGWLRWSEAIPATVIRPGKSPIALRVRLSDGSGFDLTEAGTKKSLAAYLVRDVREVQSGLVALHEVAELFPLDFTHDLQFMLALTVVGYPAFGYVRTYKDSEGEEYHGLVVNLAQARPHVEGLLGHFSLERLINLIRHGFFNREGFLLAYTAYCDAIGRAPERPAERANASMRALCRRSASSVSWRSLSRISSAAAI